ncbi:MAG: crotonase/enoyl-CoA hydratase family protein [Pseudomonadota bacterium]
MGERIVVTNEAGVAHATLSRGDKMNALDDAMIDALVDTGERLDEDKSVRAVVLSGEGRAFCAGLDMSNFQKMSAGESDMNLAERTHGTSNKVQRMATIWRDIRPPVIAAVHGAAYGGGLQIMMGADIRIVHPEAKLSIMEVKWGLVPDLGASVLLPFMVRDDIARELTYTGRVFSGEEAQAYGFATHVSETPLEDALKLAGEIAGRSPDAVQASKRIFNAMSEMSPADRLMLESRLQEGILGLPNQIEAVMSAFEKRAGNFKD